MIIKESIKLPEVITLSTEFGRKFSLWEMYRSFVFAPGAISKMIGNKKSKLVVSYFMRRLQFSVTDVNGCPACTYQHTKINI